MSEARTPIDETITRKLVSSQFPQFAHLPITAVLPGGWDNRTFRLGETMAVRLPSAACYAPQIGREAIAFEGLAGQLSLTIPSRAGTGHPEGAYLHDWAINHWLDGISASAKAAADSIGFAHACGAFLAELQSASPSGHLPPGEANFHRGGSLRHYHGEVIEALSRLDNAVLADRTERLWQQALASEWDGIPCWVHGDFFPSNLLVDSSGKLGGVIDWGLAAIGDPACDLALAWTSFDVAQRTAFRAALAPDDALWQRGRGWSLWKAVTLMTGVNRGHPDDVAASRAVLARFWADCD